MMNSVSTFVTRIRNVIGSSQGVPPARQPIRSPLNYTSDYSSDYA